MEIFLADDLFGKLCFLGLMNRVQSSMQLHVLFMNFDTFHKFHLRELLCSILFQLLYLLDCWVIYAIIKLWNLTIADISTTRNIVQSLHVAIVFFKFLKCIAQVVIDVLRILSTFFGAH